MLRAATLALALAVAHAASTANRATPVEKVIGLLEKLSQETADEGQKEAIGYDKFACFCKAQADQKLKNIAESESKIEKLASEITQLDSNVVDSNKEIKKLETECEEE